MQIVEKTYWNIIIYMWNMKHDEWYYLVYVLASKDFLYRPAFSFSYMQFWKQLTFSY